MLPSEQIAEAMVELQKYMAGEAKKVNGNMEFAFTLQDGAVFSIKYKLPPRR